VGLKLNGTHQHLTYADVKLLGHNIDSKRKNTLIHASKGVSLEVNAEKGNMCCCLITRMQDKIMTWSSK
jgi:hypothetical protein